MIEASIIKKSDIPLITSTTKEHVVNFIGSKVIATNLESAGALLHTESQPELQLPTLENVRASIQTLIEDHTFPYVFLANWSFSSTWGPQLIEEKLDEIAEKLSQLETETTKYTLIELLSGESRKQGLLSITVDSNSEQFEKIIALLKSMTTDFTDEKLDALTIDALSHSSPLTLLHRIRTESEQLLQHLSDQELDMMSRNHEFSHVALEQRFELQKNNQLNERLGNLPHVLHELVAFFHDFKGQVVGSEMISDGNKLKLLQRIAVLVGMKRNVVSVTNSRFVTIRKNGQKNIFSKRIEAMQNENEAAKTNNPYCEAMLILLLGEKYFDDSDSVALISENITLDDDTLILEMIENVIKNPTEFLQSLTPAFYDKVIKKISFLTSSTN